MAHDQRLTENLLRIKHSDEFLPFRELLVRLRDEARMQTSTLGPDVMLRQMQGRAQAFQQLIDEVEKAKNRP
jgi:hypothetical protein